MSQYNNSVIIKHSAFDANNIILQCCLFLERHNQPGFGVECNCQLTTTGYCPDRDVRRREDTTLLGN